MDVEARKKMVKIYGHRGSKGDYPENSMLAFKKAIEAGVAGMELDIHMTKDGELVVIHDETLERTTTGAGYVKDYTLAEIRTLSAGAKFTEFKHYTPCWDDELVPTLMEVLMLCKAHDLEVNIELKTHLIPYAGIEEKMLEVVNASGYNPAKMIYSSFHLPTLLRIQKLDQSVKVVWLLKTMVSLPHDYMDTLGFESLHVNKDVVMSNLDFWKPIADKLRVWTVNAEAEIEALIDLGVSAIITDYPELAVKLQIGSQR